MENKEQLNTWVIFFNTTDYPDQYSARRFHGKTPTDDFFYDPFYKAALGWVKYNAEKHGELQLHKFPRYISDHESVVEVWL